MNLAFGARLKQGVWHHLRGDLATAEQAYQAILMDFGPQAEALRLLGVLAGQTGRRDQALVWLDQALVLQPGHAVAHDNRGVVLKDLQRTDEAVAAFDRALALKPNAPDILNNRAITLLAAQQWERALAAYDLVLAQAPDHAGAWNDRGLALKQLGRFDEAFASYDRALTARPGFVDALNNRGVLLKEQKRFVEAVAAYGSALALAPDYADALHNRGNALAELDRRNEAWSDYEKALALKPDDAEIAFSASAALLRAGRFAPGWRMYESRFGRALQTDRFSRRGLPRRLREGESIAGQRLFMFWEQGLGDTIQFCRFARWAEARGASVALAAPRRLHRLLRGLSARVELLEEAEAPALFDHHLPLMSAPGLLAVGPEDWGMLVPYLRAEPERVASWRKKIGDHGFKIGVAWRGHLGNHAGRDRGFDPALLRVLAEIPGVRLISLQKRESGDEPAPPDARIETLEPDFDCGPDAFIDTAAVMEGLDLIVSCDTSIAHLAGALGRPTWLALKHVAEWRWLCDREDTPWYPTLRLFRQPRRDDWPAVFAAMVEALSG